MKSTDYISAQLTKDELIKVLLNSNQSNFQVDIKIDNDYRSRDLIDNIHGYVKSVNIDRNIKLNLSCDISRLDTTIDGKSVLIEGVECYTIYYK